VFSSKKVRAKVSDTSQNETWSGVSEKCGRAEGAQGGENLKSALRAQANSVGGQRNRNEIDTDSFFIIQKHI